MTASITTSRSKSSAGPPPDRPGPRRAWLLLTVFAVLAGLFWRTAHRDNRPLHADEAVQAWLTWNLLRGEGYAYDPLDRHGPLLYFTAAGWHRLRGGTAAGFDDSAARSTVLWAGFATLVLVGFAPVRSGALPGTGALAATLLAWETLSTLYHTYFVQEAWLALAVWAFLFLLLASPSRPRFLLRGLTAGLAQTAKEIAPLYLLIAALAVWWARRAPPGGDTPPRKSFDWRNGALAAVGFVVPFVALYSSFGTHWQGVPDAFRTYALQAGRVTGDAHQYPWWHYLKTLGILPTGGPRWGQYPLLLLALAGVVLALRPRAGRFLRATAGLTVALLVFHSVVPYKTPWLLLTPMVGLVLLAAAPLAALAARGRFGLALSLVLAAGTAWHSHHIGRLALDRYPGDPRNPYFYEQTPRAFLRLPNRIEQLADSLHRPLTVAVVSPEHAWPLPWYLRDRPEAGYFDAAPPGLNARDIVVWDSQLGPAPAELGPPRIVEYAGLRPNVLLEVSIAAPTWNAVFPPQP